MAPLRKPRRARTWPPTTVMLRRARVLEEEDEDGLADALARAGYRGEMVNARTGNCTRLRTFAEMRRAGSPSVIEGNVRQVFPRGMKLWRVRADEVNGERSRLIEFLVYARTEHSAERKGIRALRGEWGDRDRTPACENALVTFGNGEIAIDDVRVEHVTAEQVIAWLVR